MGVPYQLPLSAALSTAALFIVVMFRTLTSGSMQDVGNDDHFAFSLDPPLLRVLCGFVCLFATFLFAQSTIKFWAYGRLKADVKNQKGKRISFADVKYGAEGRKYYTLLADRTVGNTMEWAFPFLILLIANASVTTSHNAAFWGWMWLLSRSIYPVVFSFGAPVLFVSTFSGYFVLIALAHPVFTVALSS